MSDETDELGKRVQAAIAAARALTANLRDQRQIADRLIKQFSFRANFHPKTLKFFSPLDFRESRRPSRPFPPNADAIQPDVNKSGDF